MADRRGVGVRLFVEGGPEVRREFSQTGEAGKRMWSEVASGQRTVSPALRAVSAGVNEAKAGVQGLAAEAGPAGRVLGSIGPAGIAAAAAVGGLAIAFGQARKAMEIGDELADQAAKVGISTDTLQEYRYAVLQTGGALNDADTALAAFTRTLGAAESGLSPKAFKAFAALGFTKEQLKDFGSADEALRAVTARVAALSSEAERAAVADKLGLTPMLPLLREDVAGLDALRAAAHTTGFVMDAELIRRMGEANDKFEASALIIRNQFASAFVELVPILVGVMQTIADLARQTNDFFDGFKRIEERQTQSLLDKRHRLIMGMTQVSMSPSNLDKNGFLMPAARTIYNDLARQSAEVEAELQRRRSAPPIVAPVPGGPTLTVPTRTGGRRGPRPQQPLPETIDPMRAIDPLTGDFAEGPSARDLAYRAIYGFLPGANAASPQTVSLTVDLEPTIGDRFKARTTEIRDNVRDAFAQGLEAAFSGNFFDFLKYRFRQALFEGLADLGATAFANFATSSRGGSGFGSLIVQGASLLLSSGRRAAGGFVAADAPFSHGEMGFELAGFGRNGRVFSHEDTLRLIRGMAGGARGGGDMHVTYAPNIDARGAGPREIDELRAEMRRDQQRLPGVIVSTVGDALERRMIRPAE